MRRDPDGPDNIHPLGEPCQTDSECLEVYRLESKLENLGPFKQRELTSIWNSYADKVDRRGLVTRHTADVSHVTKDGKLTVVTGPIPGDTNQASKYSRIMLEARNDDYRLVLKGTMSDAIQRERELAGEPLKYVRIFAHGAAGRIFEQSGREVSVVNLIKDVMPALAPGATLDFTSCNIAQTARMRELLQVVANKHEVVIRANGNMGTFFDETAKRHAYVFTPNPNGEKDYENTAIFASSRIAKQEALNKLRSSGGSR